MQRHIWWAAPLHNWVIRTWVLRNFGRNCYMLTAITILFWPQAEVTTTLFRVLSEGTPTVWLRFMKSAIRANNCNSCNSEILGVKVSGPETGQINQNCGHLTSRPSSSSLMQRMGYSLCLSISTWKTLSRQQFVPRLTWKRPSIPAHFKTWPRKRLLSSSLASTKKLTSRRKFLLSFAFNRVPDSRTWGL